ncbi:MAG: Gfo/Idh/MocA family protein [Micromonosporaceae bacterium]
MRFGLVGTGPWAVMAHGPGLRTAEGVELVGVWGRNPQRARGLADTLGVEAYDDYAALLADVEAVAFAVPPDIQAPMAVRAAAAGRHLLLEKPLALTVPAAQELAGAVAAAGVASVVFFTDRFAPESREWFATVGQGTGWRGGWTRMLASLDAPGNPYAESAWRRRYGALWDIGPHALSTLTAVLGPITNVTAVGGVGDLVHLVVGHESGATSTASLSLFAPEQASSFETAVWGEGGTAYGPARITPTADSLAVAATELVAAAESGQPHPAGVELGRRVVELLADAEAQVQARTTA